MPKENINTLTNEEKALEEEKSKGAVLKETREAKGITLEAVHEATKIPLDALRAIEEGYTVRTLTPFYHKGFLKIYANYLGLDASDVIEGYKKEELPQYIHGAVEELDFKIHVKRFLTKERIIQIGIVCGILLSLFMLFKLLIFINTKISRKEPTKTVKLVQPVKKVIRAPEKPVVRKVVTPQKPPQKTPQPKAVVPVTVDKPAPLQEANVSKNVVLTVRAKKESWLLVKSDDTVVFQSTLRLGAVETWVADEKIEISGRNINDMEFELNVQMIGTLGRKDRNAKKLIVTKDGLTVTK